jgi:hypothetical protein
VAALRGRYRKRDDEQQGGEIVQHKADGITDHGWQPIMQCRMQMQSTTLSSFL